MIHTGFLVGSDSYLDGQWLECGSDILQLMRRDSMPSLDDDPDTPLDVTVCSYRLFKLTGSDFETQLWVPVDWPEESVATRALEWFMRRELKI